MLKKAKGIESDIGLLKRIFSYVPNWKKFNFLKSPFDTMLTPVFFIFHFQGTLGLYLPRHCKRICKVWSWASQVDQEVWGCECYNQEGSKLYILIRRFYWQLTEDLTSVLFVMTLVWMCWYKCSCSLTLYTLTAECKEILCPNMLHFNCCDIVLMLNCFSWYLHSLLR